MIFFTADHHFGHANIVHYTNRPFANIAEMDSELIRRWNETVGTDDEVYHLGDFTLGGLANHYFEQLNGSIHILANRWHHDRRWIPDPEEPWIRSANGAVVTILPPMEVLTLPCNNCDHPQAIVLCHYPLAVWDRKHYGSWHLHGHSHCNYESLDPEDKIMDVGVDCMNFKPVSIEDVAGHMAI